MSARLQSGSGFLLGGGSWYVEGVLSIFLITGDHGQIGSRTFRLGKAAMTGRSIEFVSIDTLAGRLDCKPEEIEALVRRGQFPGPVLIGPLRRWDVERVRAFIAQVGTELRASARPEPLAPNGLPGPDSDPFLRALED